MAGKVWDEANAEALKHLELSKDSAFVHPFDHPTIWYVPTLGPITVLVLLYSLLNPNSLVDLALIYYSIVLITLEHVMFDSLK